MAHGRNVKILPGDFDRWPIGLRWTFLYFTVLALLGTVTFVLAPWDIGTFSVNGEWVTGPEFFWSVGPAFFLAAVLAWIATIALYTHHPRAREAVMVAWLGACGWSGSMAVRYPEPSEHALLGFAASTTALLWWYLFVKPTSRAFFGDVADGNDT